jgi:hypothetical protein
MEFMKNPPFIGQTGGGRPGFLWKEAVFSGLNRRKIIYYEVLDQKNNRMNLYGSLAKKSI